MGTSGSIEGIEEESFQRTQTETAAGTTIESMPPMGNFKWQRLNLPHVVGWAAGSGITPIMSIAKTVLENNDKYIHAFLWQQKQQQYHL